MPLSTTTQMLQNAKATKTAVGAFNVENMEMAQGVLDAANEIGCPIILQISTSTTKYAPINIFVSMIKAMADNVAIPVALHLDHADQSLVFDALKAGFTSVMYDGSKESYEENIRQTKIIVEAAFKINIPVEAELGGIGGKEDDVSDQVIYTDPIEAAEFVKKTGVSSLAVSIGTMHGVYKNTPKLDIERLKSIRDVVDVPLVLHGASGLSNDDLKKCIHAGICKINFGTDLRVAYTQGIKEYMNQNPNKFDPRVYGKIAKERVRAIVKEKIAAIS